MIKKKQDMRDLIADLNRTLPVPTKGTKGSAPVGYPVVLYYVLAGKTKAGTTCSVQVDYSANTDRWCSKTEAGVIQNEPTYTVTVWEKNQVASKFSITSGVDISYDCRNSKTPNNCTAVAPDGMMVGVDSVVTDTSGEISSVKVLNHDRWSYGKYRCDTREETSISFSYGTGRSKDFTISVTDTKKTDWHTVYARSVDCIVPQ